jgi:PAS domain-containing protein
VDTPGLTAIEGVREDASERRASSDGREQRLHLVHVGPRRDPDEETLAERERRLAELLNALPAAVYTTDAAGRIINEAAAELWGHRPVLGTGSGAAPGSCTGRTAHRCPMKIARWRWP